MSEGTGIVVCGAAGRMGRRLVALAHEHPGLTVQGAIEAPASAGLGTDAGLLAGIGPIGIPVTDDLAACVGPTRVVIDFTVPEATVRHAAIAAEHGAALVIGTTGLSAEQDAALRTTVASTRTVIAANYSIGITILEELVGLAAYRLDPSFEIEIVEMHHHHKRDAPSGTALALGRAAAAGRGDDFDRVAVRGRTGLVGPRRQEEIGLMALRGGDVVGDHTVVLAGLGERIELTHRAHSRDCLVRGALRAAEWIVDQAPGIYGMRDVLGMLEA